MARASQVVVLAEDQRHQRLIYKYLHRFDLQSVTRFEALPSGRGCGEQWVRERYAESVRGFRKRHAHTVLIVVIDADAGSTNRRLRQLEGALSSKRMPPRTAEEKIIHLIPKRNIETWILNLNGDQVDEETDFRHAPGIDARIEFAAQTFIRLDTAQRHAPTALCALPGRGYPRD